MAYNVNFCIVSLAYLCIVVVFYGRQVHVASRRSRLFAAMLYCGVLSLVLDIFVALIDPFAHLWPSSLVCAANVLFLLTAQTAGLLFFNYSISLAGVYTRMKRGLKLATLLPFAIVVVLLLLSLFTPYGVFYLDDNNVYHHGATHFLLYVTTAIYLIASLAVVLARRRHLQKLKIFTILSFLLVTMAAMLIQTYNPYLLVNSTANAFALLLMYYVLEAPSTHVDALTGVLNRTALMPQLSDVFEEGERCSVLMYSLDSLHIVNHSFGMKGGDEALAAYAGYLAGLYPKCSIFRIEGDVFCVLLRGGKPVDADDLAARAASTQGTFPLSAGEVPLEASLFCINSEGCASAQEMIALLEALLVHEDFRLKHGSAMLVDAAYKEQVLAGEAVERATMRALDEGRVDVFYQPIHDSGGKLCALEALVRIFDPELGLLPVQEAVEYAEKNGSIVRLGEQVLRQTCAFLQENDVASWGLDHVGVNLSVIQCTQEGLPQLVSDILSEYDMPEGLVAFEVTETAVGALSMMRENMEQLSGRGIHFLLDDFGTGYANFRNLTALPYRCVKIDKSLLWAAQESESRMHLLEGVVGVVHALGLASVCEGVETAEQAQLVVALGVSMLQGYYYSKPLSQQDLLAYAHEAGVC